MALSPGKLLHRGQQSRGRRRDKKRKAKTKGSNELTQEINVRRGETPQEKRDGCKEGRAENMVVESRESHSREIKV